MSNKKTYTICAHATGRAIGEIEMTEEQFREYDRNCEQPAGVMEAQFLPGGIVWSDVPEDGCKVFLVD